MSQDKPHDSLFRYAFSDPATITAHFQAVLPPKVVEALDWPSLMLQPTTCEHTLVMGAPV